MHNPAEFSGSDKAVSAYLDYSGSAVLKPTVFALHDEAVIGRELQDSLAPEQFCCIPEHTVSRRHARIRRRGDAYFIEDLHSVNGTFVLGQRLQPGTWHRLRDGETFSVATLPLVFHSLLIPSHDSVPRHITSSIDATEYVLGTVPSAAPVTGDLQQTVRKLHAMAQVGIALGAVTDRATLTEKIMQLIFDLFPLAERAFIVLRQGPGESPVPVAARRRDGSAEDVAQLGMSRTLIADVFDSKRSILSVDTLADRHFGAQESIIAQAIRSVMCVPLLIAAGDHANEAECLGLIEVDTSSDPHAFKEQDLEMLTGVCAEAAVALKNFQLYADIERLLDGFVRASVQAIEERDPVTAGHSFRVASLAEQLAMAVDRADDPTLRNVHFSKQQLREMRYAALLHDFGKVGVREHVLLKEKKLHPADLRLLQSRSRHARACLAAQAYRALTDRHLQSVWSIAEFAEQKRQCDSALHTEVARLDQFLETIHAANEPAISANAHTSVPDLSSLQAYRWQDPDGTSWHFLDEEESAALCVAKGCLTLDERRQIQAHVADSYSFLILIPWTRDLAGVPNIAHGHHEKLDGSGYPMGLRGAQIGMPTRILTICDIYDALTASDRPYKSALPVPQALELMRAECDAGRLDRAVFEVFVDAGIRTPV